MIDMYSLAMLVAGLLAGTIAGWYLARRASPRPKAVDEPAKPANGGYQILGSIGVPVLLLSSGNTVLFANRSAEAVFPVRTGASLLKGFRNPELLKAIEEVREIGVSQTVHYREAPPRGPLRVGARKPERAAGHQPDLERGRRNPTVVTLFHLASTLGVGPVDLISPDEEVAGERAKAQKRKA